MLVVNLRDGETTIKIRIAFLRGGGMGGGEENRPKTLFLLGKRHDNKILKVQTLFPRNLVVIAQAPKIGVCPLVAKFCAERPVFPRVVGELGSRSKNFARRGHEANASQGTQPEAPG